MENFNVLGLIIFCAIWALAFPNLAARDLNRRAQRIRICEDPEREEQSIREVTDRIIENNLRSILQEQMRIQAQIVERERSFIDMPAPRRYYS